MKFAKKLSALTLSAVLFGTSIAPVSAASKSEIVGANRYETAAKIADRMGNYNTAILVNSDKSLADGLSASSLAGKENAPILLVKKNSIPKETLKRLQNVNKVYIIGGKATIGSDVESKLSGKNIIRIEGRNRIETSEKVAKLVGNYNKAFIVNGNKGEADAMSVASVAARDKAPILLTNGKTSKQGKKSGVTYYVIGGKSVVSSGLASKFGATRLSGNDRYRTNRAVVKKFYSKSKKLYYTKGNPLVDALTVSSLAKNNGVVLVSKNSDNSILKGKDIVQVGGINFNVDLSGNSKPVITTKKDTVTLEFLGEWDLSGYGLRAYDKEDGDLTNEIMIINPPIIIYPGTYKLNLEVSDSKGAKAYKTLTLIVKEPSGGSGNKPDGNKPGGNKPGGNRPSINVNSEAYQSEYRKEFYKLINAHRASKGKQPLTPESGLERWAYLKSKHMADYNYFDHYYNGQLIHEMYPNEGGSARFSAENIYYARGYTPTAKEFAQQSFNGWKNSDGHNKNMLSGSYNHVGVAVYQSNDGKIYATTDFGW